MHAEYATGCFQIEHLSSVPGDGRLKAQSMQIAAKIVAGISSVLAVFAFAVFVESSIRSRYREPMSIVGLPINNASVTGTWMPDFLWAGKAWKIDIKSDEDLELILDDKVYIIPKGSHQIHSNHDHTNTGQFGGQEFWGYPENIEVRPLARKRQLSK
jgi:hypothetical protein